MSATTQADELIAASFTQDDARQDARLVKTAAEAACSLRRAFENVATDANSEELAGAAREALDALDNLVADHLTNGLAFVAQTKGDRTGIDLQMERAVLAIYDTPEQEEVQ